MTEPSKVHWKRVAAEAGAIVGSILLALWLDAWWEERQDRKDEAELLSRLRIEFTNNLERIESRDFYRLILERSKDMFGLVSSAADQDTAVASVPALTIRAIAFAPTYEADTPIFDGLVRSGRMEVIQNRQIHAALAAWERLLRDYTALAERSRRNVDTQLLPALYERGDVGEIFMRQRPVLGSENDPAWLDLFDVRVDSELRGLVSSRYNSGLQAQEKFDELREAAIEVIEAVDQHIAGQ